MSQNYTWPSVSVTATNPSVAPNGSNPAATSSTLVAGETTGGTQVPIQVLSSGAVVTSSTPSGTQDVNLIQVGGVAVSLGAKVSASSIPVVLASDETVQISASSLPLPTGAATSANQSTIIANQTNGTQVVSVNNFPATQPVSGTVAVSNFPATQPVSAVSLPLPTGASTSANQTTMITDLGSILANQTNGTQTTSVLNFPATQPVSGTVTASVAGKSVANPPVYNIYSSSNIDTTAYVQLIASTANPTTLVDIFDSSGQAMILATGAMGSEVIQAYVQPGGDTIPLAIPAGTRVAYKALTANATAGYLLMNLLD